MLPICALPLYAASSRLLPQGKLNKVEDEQESPLYHFDTWMIY